MRERMEVVDQQTRDKRQERRRSLSLSLSFSLSRGGGGQVTLSFFSILVVVHDGRP